MLRKRDEVPNEAPRKARWRLAHVPKGLNYGQILIYGERGAGGTIWQPFTPNSSGRVMIHTSKGAMFASLGDWIIRDAEGEFYPVKDEMFQATYEPVEEEK
ncbi:MAG: hypothetical protein KGI06_06205 [Candidatus Micrarchaeota archaeon]|nr:hypothetical protein [Candidatus Micrarchaeota archaeon]